METRDLPIKYRMYDFSAFKNNQYVETFIQENPDNPKNIELLEASKWVIYSKLISLSIPFVVFYIINYF